MNAKAHQTEISSKETITIDLSASLITTSIAPEQLLQKAAFEQIQTHFDAIKTQAVKYSSSRRNEFEPVRCNNTIFIHGERGAGKTTFLRTLLSHYHINSEASEGKICPLPLIDPTLVETQQHIFVEIITRFAQLVTKKLSACCDAEKYQRFSKALDCMAEGLQLLNGQSASAKYDASWYLNKAIGHASSGLNLESCFHQFMDTLTEVLDVELFVIAIDDVDTKTDKASDVLEILRCYLTHPRLVVLLSGDLKLYSHIVRINKQKELSAKLSDQDEQGKQLIEHLEQQYLAKVLPVEQRVNLKRLTEVIASHEVMIKHTALPIGSNKSLAIDALLKTIFSQALCIHETHLASHLDFILNQPVRSVLQLIKTMLESKKGQDSYQASDLKIAIYHNFIGALVDEQLQLDNLTPNTPYLNTVGYEMFKLVHKHGELETGFYARPDSSYDQSGYNAAKLYLSSSIAVLCNGAKSSGSDNSFSRAIKWMLLGDAPASIYQHYVAYNIADNAKAQDYLDYIGLNRNERISSVAAHFSPIVLHHKSGEYNKKVIEAGVVRIPNRVTGKASDKFKMVLDHYNLGDELMSLDDLVKKSNTTDWEFWDFVAAKAVLLAAHKGKESTEGRSYISVYSLLAALAEFVESPDELEHLANIPTYSSPNFLLKSAVIDNESAENIISQEDLFKSRYISEDNNHQSMFKKSMKKWREELPTDYKISSLLMGKIWTRIYYSLAQISLKAQDTIAYRRDEESGQKFYRDILLGELFARFVWTIINASLIEECRYRFARNDAQYKSIKAAKNVTTSPMELIKNITALKTENFKKDLPLTYSLFSCPLFLPFIPTELLNILRRRHREFYDIYLLKMSAFNNIRHVSLPAGLKISLLPVMGCFSKEDENDLTADLL